MCPDIALTSYMYYFYLILKMNLLRRFSNYGPILHIKEIKSIKS